MEDVNKVGMELLVISGMLLTWTFINVECLALDILDYAQLSIMPQVLTNGRLWV